MKSTQVVVPSAEVANKKYGALVTPLALTMKALPIEELPALITALRLAVADLEYSLQTYHSPNHNIQPPDALRVLASPVEVSTEWVVEKMLKEIQHNPNNLTGRGVHD